MRKESAFTDNGVVHPMGPIAVESSADCYELWICARLPSLSQRKKESPKTIRK